ncbi:hypothetical protein JCM10212_006967 [Sporobolomyces blumeae]
MGALCGKEDHFDALSKGQTLGSTTSGHSARPRPPPSGGGGPSSATPGYSISSTNKKGVSTSPPQRLGGGGGEIGQGGAGGGPDREAMLRAAEARSKANETRGTSGGKLAKQLERQKRDGGRADEARREAEQRGEPLVWD